MASNDLFVFYTHFWSESLLLEAKRLVSAVQGRFDFIICGLCDADNSLRPFERTSLKTKTWSREDLKALPYSRKIEVSNWSTLRGANDLALMALYREQPTYNRYWIMEYDVRFSGDWNIIFDDLALSDADLLCTQVTNYEDNPDWVQWKTLIKPTHSAENAKLLGGFMPFCRISQRLMAKMDEYYRGDWAGHYEVLWPTIALRESLTVEDIGGRGRYTPSSRAGKYYRSAYIDGIYLSTFGAWPFYSSKSSFNNHLPTNVLWHPVKE